jgi:hypothetical protein
MNTWLWTVNNLLDDIDRDMDRLSYTREEDEVLMTFPQNPTSCGDYRGCPYHDYCLAWPNPLRHADEPPLGFVTKFWDPREKESKVRKDLNFNPLM